MKINTEEIENQIVSISTDISIIDSLICFLNLGIEDKFDLTNHDLANLTIVIRNMIKSAKTNFDEIEQILDI